MNLKIFGIKWIKKYLEGFDLRGGRRDIVSLKPDPQPFVVLCSAVAQILMTNEIPWKNNRDSLRITQWF